MEFPLLIEVIEEQKQEMTYKKAIEESDALTRTPNCKKELREQIAADVEAYLRSGKGIEILPPGKSTDLDHDESWRSFSL